jgi:phosphotransacetylase/acyl dehydratase
MATVAGQIANRRFEDIAIGERAVLQRRFGRRDLATVASLCGADAAAQIGAERVESEASPQPVVHGLWQMSLISTLLATALPGGGTIPLEQALRFLAPITLGDTLTVAVTVREKDSARQGIGFDCRCTNQDGAVVIDGTMWVIAPGEALRRASVPSRAAAIQDRGAKFRAMITLAETLPPIVTAIVHPVEANALTGAAEAAHAGLITPVLVGPEAKIRAAARAAGVDIAAYRLVTVEHSHAAALTAAQMAGRAEVQALMKGSLHTDEFLHPVLDPVNHLRTERRLSHVFLLDVPSHSRLLFITDGAININPDLDAKRDIVQNAIDMAHALGIASPRVAILSAVEVVNPKIASTLDAAALCKMAERGQITGGVVDGPLAFDNAVSPAATAAKHIVSEVAGRADILVAPDLDAGNMLAKQLEYLADADIAGVVLGARIPVILTSRADSAHSRLASCAVAALIEQHRRTRIEPPA